MQPALKQLILSQAKSNSKKYFERGECVRRDIERWNFDIFKEQIEVFRLHDNACK